MSIEKMQIKALMADGMGREAEEEVTKAQAKVYKLQGAHDALQQAARLVSEMSSRIVDEFKEGKIKIDPTDDMVVAKFVVAKQQEVVAKLKEMCEVARVSSIKADGERAAFDSMAERFKKTRDAEINKIEAVKRQVESGEIIIEDGVPTASSGTHRVVGTHPGPTIKMKRKAEEAAESKGNGVAKKPRRKKAKSEALHDKDA